MANNQIALCLCCFLIVIPAIILIPMSLSTLHSTETGLNFNYVTMSISPTPYTAGLHMIGPAHVFIRFPNTYQNLQFSTSDHDLLHTRTSDGLPLTLGVSFQYTLQQDHLYDLYMKYKTDYKEVLFNIAGHVIADTACNYTAYNFFNDKQSIAVAMQAELNKATTASLYITVETLQIILVQLPLSFEDAILESIATKQNITRTEKYKEATAVTFETQIMAGKQQANQTLAIAAGNAGKASSEAKARAEAFNQTVQAEIISYSQIQSALHLSGEELINYIWWDSIGDQQSQSQLLVDMTPSSTFVASRSVPHP